METGPGHDWVAIGLAALAIIISAASAVRRPYRRGNYTPPTSDKTPNSPPPKPKR